MQKISAPGRDKSHLLLQGFITLGAKGPTLIAHGLWAREASWSLSEHETWGSSFDSFRHNDQSCVVTVPRFVFVCVTVPRSHADDELGFLGRRESLAAHGTLIRALPSFPRHRELKEILFPDGLGLGKDL